MQFETNPTIRLHDMAIVARQSFVLVFAVLGMLAGGYLLVAPSDGRMDATIEVSPEQTAATSQSSISRP